MILIMFLKQLLTLLQKIFLVHLTVALDQPLNKPFNIDRPNVKVL